MKIACMQPYAFPYLGYFQLISAVDQFVFLDDVNFINRGWIEHNRILGPLAFSIPLQKKSQNKKIQETLLAEDLENWTKKFYKTLEQTYRKAPHYEAGLFLVKTVLEGAKGDIGALAEKSIQLVFDYIGKKQKFSRSSTMSLPELKGPARILEICKRLNATTYVNASGGRELYDRQAFSSHGIALRFIQNHFQIYQQQGTERFQEQLSIIDLLMFCSKEQLSRQFQNFDLED